MVRDFDPDPRPGDLLRAAGGSTDPTEAPSGDLRTPEASIPEAEARRAEMARYRDSPVAFLRDFGPRDLPQDRLMRAMLDTLSDYKHNAFGGLFGSARRRPADPDKPQTWVNPDHEREMHNHPAPPEDPAAAPFRPRRRRPGEVPEWPHQTQDQAQATYQRHTITTRRSFGGLAYTTQGSATLRPDLIVIDDVSDDEGVAIDALADKLAAMVPDATGTTLDATIDYGALIDATPLASPPTLAEMNAAQGAVTRGMREELDWQERRLVFGPLLLSELERRYGKPFELPPPRPGEFFSDVAATSGYFLAHSLRVLPPSRRFNIVNVYASDSAPAWTPEDEYRHQHARLRLVLALVALKRWHEAEGATPDATIDPAHERPNPPEEA